jgi:hypothetical protein
MKSREAERIPKSAIDETQAAQLQRRADWGQIAWVVVRLRGVWFRVDWARWNDGDRKSHNAKQLAEIGTELPVVHGGLPDLLHNIS